MIIIGEKINGTIPGTKPIIENQDNTALVELAQKQASAGATYIDVNVGIGKGSQEHEIANMKWAVKTLTENIEKPLCIDSADPAVLDAGLSMLNGRKGMINSTKAEDHNLDEVLPLAAKYEAPVVALAMDETGIPKTVEGRIGACKKIASFAQKHNVPMGNIFFDPLVLPISADGTQGKITLETLMAIKSTFPESKTVMGLSNVSYGLPSRLAINAAFMNMAIYAGLDAAIINPMEKVMAEAILTGEAIMGKDRHFRKYSRAFR